MRCIRSLSPSSFDLVSTFPTGILAFLLLVGLATSFLSSFDTGRISLRTTRGPGQRFHQSTTLLEWTAEITFCLFTKDVQFSGIGFEDAFEGHDTLNEKGLGVFEVAMLVSSAFDD